MRSARKNQLDTVPLETRETHMSTLLRSSLFLACAIGAMTFACNNTSESAKDEGDTADNAATGTVDGTPHSMMGGHNMTLFGDANKLYLSHIPLYQNPHGKQVIVEVAITSGVPATGLAQFNTNNFTVAPKAAMSLYDFASGTIPALTGTIYFGNLESGGRPVYRDVQFAVKKVVFQKTLSSATPANEKLQYVAMGTPDNAYLVHVIDKAPSYDQVVSVKLPANSSLTAEMLDQGTLVTVNGGVNGIRTRLSANLTVQAEPQITVTPAPAAGTATETPNWRRNAGADTNGPDIIIVPPSNSVTVLKELGCLPGPDFYGACPAVSVTH